MAAVTMMSAARSFHCIDGNGMITFNNASAHADVLKAGVFGTNGGLFVGGGTLSADSTLKLYAPGEQRQLIFSFQCHAWRQQRKDSGG